MEPSLAVIVPTYDRADLVGRAIDSVLGQAPHDVELVVVDDGSTDGTAGVLDRYRDDARVHVVVQPNAGVSAARNTGLAQSRARFVAFLDSDDEAGPGWIDFFHGAAADEVRFASCGVRMRGGHERVLRPKPSGAEFGYIRARFLAGAFGIDRCLLQHVGGFRAGLRYSEHTDLALRLGAVMLEEPFTCVHTDEPLLVTYPSPRVYDPQLRYESAMIILRDDAEHLARSSHLHATYAAIAGVAARRLGRTREARRLLWEAVRANPRAASNYVRLARTLLPRRVDGSLRP